MNATDYTFEHRKTYTPGVGPTYDTCLCFLGCRETWVSGSRTQAEGEQRAREAHGRKLDTYQRLLRGA